MYLHKLTNQIGNEMSFVLSQPASNVFCVKSKPFYNKYNSTFVKNDPIINTFNTSIEYTIEWMLQTVRKPNKTPLELLLLRILIFSFECVEGDKIHIIIESCKLLLQN